MLYDARNVHENAYSTFGKVDTAKFFDTRTCNQSSESMVERSIENVRRVSVPLGGELWCVDNRVRSILRANPMLGESTSLFKY